MDIRSILKNRDRISDIMMYLDGIAEKAGEPKTNFENTNRIMLDIAIAHCEEAHNMLEWLYERLLDIEYEEVFEDEGIKQLV